MQNLGLTTRTFTPRLSLSSLEETEPQPSTVPCARIARLKGIVAKTSECASAGPWLKSPASDRQPKQPVDKLQLGEWVTFAHPSGSPLPNHVDRLDSL